MLYLHVWCGFVGLMVDGWMVFGVIVCPIVAAFIPVIIELLLGILALEPP